MRPIGGGFLCGTHLEGDLFTGLPPGLAADDVNGCVACDPVKPGGQDRAGGQSGGVAGELREDRQGHLLRQFRRPDLPDGSRIHQIQVPVYQGGESVLRLVADEAFEQFMILCDHLSKHNGTGPENPTKFFQIRPRRLGLPGPDKVVVYGHELQDGGS